MPAILRFKVPEEYLDRRAIRQELRKQFKNIGETWHEKHRRRHFSHFGARLYGYEPRRRSYNFRKRKRFGHTLPLVFTGVSRKLSQTKRIRVSNSGTPERPQLSVHITMPIRVFNFKPRGSNVNMRQEFSTISRDELDLYERNAVDALEDRISRLRPRRTRNIG